MAQIWMEPHFTTVLCSSLCDSGHPRKRGPKGEAGSPASTRKRGLPGLKGLPGTPGLIGFQGNSGLPGGTGLPGLAHPNGKCSDQEDTSGCQKKPSTLPQLAPSPLPRKGEQRRRWAGLFVTRYLDKDIEDPTQSKLPSLPAGWNTGLNNMVNKAQECSSLNWAYSFVPLLPQSLTVPIFCDFPARYQRLGRKHFHFIQGEVTGVRSHNWLVTVPD